MAQRVLACTGCHGAQGRAAPDGYYPRLAGKPAGYLVQPAAQLSRRPPPVRADERPAGAARRCLPGARSPRTSRRSRCRIRRRQPRGAPSDPQRAVAERLVHEGDAARHVPACVACHGSAMTGAAPFVPGLLGLPRDYLNAQLGAWRTGKRHAQAPDCMAQVAQALGAGGDRRGGRVAGFAAGARPAAKPATGLAAHPRRSPAAASAMRRRARVRHRRGVRRSCCRWPCSAAVVAWLNVRGEDDVGASGAGTASPGRPTPRWSRAAATSSRAGDCQGCHTERGGPPFAGGRRHRDAVRRRLLAQPDARRGDRPRRLVGRRLLARAAPRPVESGRLLYPAFPYPNYTRVDRADADAMFAMLRSLAPVAQPNQPHALAFPFDTQAALAVWRALYFRPGDACRRSVADGGLEPRRLSRRRSRPLQRLPFGAQRARRHRRAARPAGRADPGAELVRAVARVAARGGSGRLAGRRGRAPAQDGVSPRRAS